MFVVRTRYVIVGLWAFASVVGLLSASGLTGLLSTPLSVPNTASASANQILIRHFGENVAGTFTIVLPIGNEDSHQVDLDKSRIVRAIHVFKSAQISEEQAVFGVLYANVTTPLDLKTASSHTATLRRALLANGLPRALVTGPPALQYDLTPVLTSDLQRGEVVAVVLALILLVAVLGLSFAVAVPVIVAGATIAVDIGIVYLLAQRFTMVLYVPNAIELIALGLAVDYSLLIVHRFRQELSLDHPDVTNALRATLTTAGRTVAVSSAIVAIGLAILSTVPVPFLRSLGLAGLVVPLVAMTAALTLVPALLAILGHRGVRPVIVRGFAGGDVLTGRWARLGRAVVGRPRRTLAIALIFLALCTAPVFGLLLTPGSTSAIPADLPSARALALLGRHVGPGAITPTQIVIDLGRAHAVTSPGAKATTIRLAQRILHDPDVFAVAIGARPPFADASGRYEQIVVVGREQLGAESSQSLVHRIRVLDVPTVNFGAGTSVVVGGAPAQGVDFLGAVYGAFPWIVLAALILAYVLLARAFRSLMLALVSALLNLVTVGAAFGLLVLVFRYGVGSALLGTYHVTQIEGWVPVFLFAVLFGLSMDYEVFLVSRMRESYDSGLATTDAIVDGVARTGSVVSAAALILIAAMCGLVFGRVAGLQELGVGLALGILVDATVVRFLVLPSVMAVLGRWNWWLPQSAALVLRTTASPLEARVARP